jgi:amino acid transporter
MPEAHEPVHEHHALTADEQHLAKLGYKQELNRSWSGFSNFAISFSIISILAGCFTSFALGWNNGGPFAIAWGWPILTVFILIIGMCMSELVSAYPTSGGIYWWASKLGGPAAGFYTGWLNLIGLVAIVASVAYGCASFFDATVGYFSDSWAADYSLTRVFIEFAIVLALAATINIFSSHLLAVLNNISVWWHVIGAIVIVAILWFFLADGTSHASVGDVFTGTVNNTGLFSGHTSGLGFILYVLPLSGILTQYTITGYDASAHLSEETQAASTGAAQGIWRSILYSGIGGWILLLSFLFAVQDKDGVTAGGGSIFAVFNQALTPHVAGFVILISTLGQFFCTVACLTSTSRMFFAFSRDGAMPGAKYFSQLNANRVPVYAVVTAAIIALVLTLPALLKVDIGGAPVPIAFFAVVSIGVIGLYAAFAIPIYLRWRMGDSFQPGSWTNGSKYKWMNIVAVVEIVVMSVVGLLPTSTVGIWWNDGFAWRYVNYAIIVVPAALILLTIYWHVSVKHWFTGPKMTIDPDVVRAFED